MATRDKDPKLTKRQVDNVRARLAGKADKIIDKLLAHGLDGMEMKPSQVKALSVALDRVMPSMQSIDQTNHTDQPELGPEELEAMLTKAVQDLAQRDPEKVKAMLEAPRMRLVK